MSYTYTLAVFDENSDVVVECDLSPDEAVKILAKALETANGARSKEVATAAPSSTPGKKRKARLCGNCGLPGHTARTCEKVVGTRESAESASKNDPLSEMQYEGVRSAMHLREFSSAQYALTKKLPPREVNAAIRSVDYEDYMLSR